MIRKLFIGGVLLLSGAALSACGGGGGGGTTVTTPPVVAARFEDQFGAKFGADFRGGANTEPADVSAGDVIPVSPTAEPVPLAGS